MALDRCTSAEMPGEPTDEALMQQAQTDDQETYATLFVRHRGPLTAFLTRFLGNHALAEDVAQETFLALWQERARYQPTRRFKRGTGRTTPFSNTRQLKVGQTLILDSMILKEEHGATKGGEEVLFSLTLKPITN